LATVRPAGSHGEFDEVGAEFGFKRCRKFDFLAVGD
jgi:hypothetical protein